VPNFQPSGFPTIDEVMQLVRSICNDTFAGVAGAQGRIFSNDAAFTLPYLNSALRKVQRRLRNEGVTFPIKDGIVLSGIPAVVTADPSVFINIGFTGTNNGTTTSSTPVLPGDCMQVYTVRQRVNGSNLQFTPMGEAQEGLPSAYQNQWLGLWEWRGYAIWMNGSLQKQDIMIRYLCGQPTINAPAASFATTPINILDCQDAVANLMAGMYGGARGAADQQLAKVAADAEEALDEMATEYIRRQQTVSYQRVSYQGGGSNATENTTLGSTGSVS
jgi:hypothetical protein